MFYIFLADIDDDLVTFFPPGIEVGFEFGGGFFLPIAEGGGFTYEFTAIPAGRDSQSGTFMYHSHYDEDRQVGLGLSGAFVIEPPGAGERYDVERTLLLAEWNLDPSSGATRPPMEMPGRPPLPAAC